MILRVIRNMIRSREFKIVITILLLGYFGLFLMIKNEFFYASVQYNLNYIKYYVENYLNDNITDIIFDNEIMIYIESNVTMIFSSLYLYVITFNNEIYTVISVGLTMYIYYYINRRFYDELFKNNLEPQVVRIGINKYVDKTILSNSIYGGMIFFLPKLLYILILSIFFPVGSSMIHFLSDVSFISDKFLYVGYNVSPYVLILMDLFMSFMYGVIISLISMIVISSFRNKALGYIVFFFTIAMTSAVMSLFGQAPLVYYSSIFKYFSSFNKFSFELNVYVPVIIISILSILIIIFERVFIYRKVKKII